METRTVSIKGSDYTVTITETEDGIVCQPWSFLGGAFTVSSEKEIKKAITARLEAEDEDA